ncbi:MAG TPA: c-type cytochrome [Casimicrobiaceae bacterium]|nr:c-type cytochrome [Casimicrobiaceae bacterium]
MKRALLLTALSICIAMSSRTRAEEAAAKPDLAKAKQIVDQVCAACHGGDGNSPSGAYPSLAGQHADYIALQLAHFKSGVRSNAIMAPMATTLSPQDMRSLGAYFEQQKPKGSAAKDAALASAGRKLFRGGDSASGVPACASCHSPDGAGIPSRYPRLSGQHADYTQAQLQAFKTGGRGNDKEGKDVNGKIMGQIAGRMSEDEIAAVAQYAAGLH